MLDNTNNGVATVRRPAPSRFARSHAQSGRLIQRGGGTGPV